MPDTIHRNLPAPSRRTFLAGAGALAAGGLTGGAAASTPNWPNGPVKIVVPYTAGGATDAIARMLADRLSKAMNATFVVDNKPGAFGMIGTDQVAKSASDGQTLALILSGAVLSNPYIYTKVPYDVERDIALIYKAVVTSGVFSVHPSVPANNFKEFIAYVKANPGKVSFGSYGQGSHPHMMLEYLRKTYGAEMTHVPYKGEAPMVQDLLAGQLQAGTASVAVQKQHFDLKKLRPMGAVAEKRIATLPDLPTLAEQGFKDEVFRMQSWFGIIGPKATPPAIQQRLTAELSKVMAAPDVQDIIVKMGYTPVSDSTPEKLLAEYREWAPRWKKLIEISGAKIDS